MKRRNLEELFLIYCKALHYTKDISRMIGDQYVIAKGGTIYLSQSDPRAGNNWAIMTNSGSGTISILYGYVTAEKMAGYLEAMIESKPPRNLLSSVKNIDWKMLREQKTHLLSVMNVTCITQDELESLTGILHLIDAVQDGAVDDGIALKEDVFNLTDEG